MWQIDRAKLAGWAREKFVHPFVAAQQRAPCGERGVYRNIEVMQIAGRMVCLFFISSCIFRAEHVNANEMLLTEKERQDISKLVNNPIVVGLNRDVQSLSEDIYLQDAQKEDAKRSLSVLTAEVRAVSSQLVNAIEEGGEDRSLLLEIGRLAKKIKSIKEDLANQDETLSDALRDLRVKSRQLAVQNEQLRKNKISLRDAIVSRLRTESGDKKNLLSQGSFQCSPQKNLNQCLSEPRRKTDIIAQASAGVDEIWEMKNISNYKIIDATMSLDGKVNYKVSFDYKQAFSDSMLAHVNDSLELSRFLVALRSNDTVEYFVDGKSYGIGKQISVILDSGVHSFYVKSSSGSASVVRRIGEDSQLYLPVSVRVVNNIATLPKALARPRSLRQQAESQKYTISNITFSLPISAVEGGQDTYIDQGNVFKRLSFEDGVWFCSEVGGRIASQLEYTKILQSPEFQTKIGFKSSYWLNETVVLSRMGEGILAKRASASDKYNIACITK